MNPDLACAREREGRIYQYYLIIMMNPVHPVRFSGAGQRTKCRDLIVSMFQGSLRRHCLQK